MLLHWKTRDGQLKSNKHLVLTVLDTGVKVPEDLLFGEYPLSYAYKPILLCPDMAEGAQISL